MKTAVWIATLAILTLALAACRPAGREAPKSQPTAAAPASPPADDVQGTSEAKPPAGNTWTYEPKTSEGRVLGAVGKAVVGSLRDDAKK